MFKRSVQGRFASSAALPGLVLALLGASVATPAEARHHHHGHRVATHAHLRHHAHHGPRRLQAAGGGVGGTAAIVVDGATGRVLYGLNEDAPRHPASVTKVMTLYLLFEQLEKGRFTLDSEIPISAHAAAQAPSKLGLRPGQTIRVEDAIKVIVTKSANDIAVAVGEAVADGTESDFAELMTRKARALGMNHTLYRNASGLPNDEQITTAADLAALGRAIQDRFPRYYRYFSIHEFAYRGQRIHTHNHLMDRCEGMDGIKTGYTAASGFNLLSSVKRDGHYIVSVVMGGKSARSRDNYMDALIEQHIEEAGAYHPGARFAEQEQPAPARSQASSQGWPQLWPQASHEDDERAVKKEAARVEPSSAAPRTPAPVERVAMVNTGSLLPIAAVSPTPRPRPAYVSAQAQPAQGDADDSHVATASIPRHVTTTTDGSTLHQAHPNGGAVTPTAMHLAPGPSAKTAFRATTHFEPPAKTEAKIDAKIEARIDTKAEAKAKARIEAESDEGLSVQPKQVASKPPVPGWMIQIGATDDAVKAEALLTRAKSQRGVALGAAKPFTEIVHKGGGTLYRARFAGLEESKAEAACKALKNSGFSCFATRN
jgi:D-alanyl-D-alanine carboxypeptidase